MLLAGIRVTSVYHMWQPEHEQQARTTSIFLQWFEDLLPTLKLQGSSRLDSERVIWIEEKDTRTLTGRVRAFMLTSAGAHFCETATRSNTQKYFNARTAYSYTVQQCMLSLHLRASDDRDSSAAWLANKPSAAT
ncbi:unnamed protein product [Polarella glacialis]|uniref:Uncharacterized protein n=1 Tax=Polarella glacialis TaxID=89957 RepID=A0A813KUT0_POLGL|nr:unnamed protein product [Polarella glacialis]